MYTIDIMENYKYIHISQIMSHGALWSVVSTNQCYLISWPCHDIYTSRKKWKKLGDIRSCVHFAVFFVSGRWRFPALICSIFIWFHFCGNIYTLFSNVSYMFCFAISLEIFFTIQHTLFYSIPGGEFRFLKRNTHRKIPNDFELKAMRGFFWRKYENCHNLGPFNSQSQRSCCSSLFLEKNLGNL